MKWLSPINYTFQAMIRTQFEDTSLSMLVSELGVTLSYLTCVWALIGLMIGMRALSLLMMKINVTKF